MKIFVTGPDAVDSFAHNVSHTLRAMDHDVRTDSALAFEMRQPAWRRGLDEVWQRVSRRRRLRRDARALRIVREFKPDLTLMCTMTFEPETVERIRRSSGGKVVCWFGDSPANLRRDHVVSGEYDAVFAKDVDFVDVLREMLGLEAHHLPEACNPSWHRPTTERSGNVVAVAGTSYGYRNAVVQRLIDAGATVRVYGPAPPLWVSDRVRAAHTGVFLDHRRKSPVFGEALACVSSFALSEGRNAVNCRIFETCACGGLLLTEARPAIEQYFEPGREYLAYSSLGECLEHLRRLETDYTEAREIRARAAKLAHAEHTYRHRLERLLSIVGM